MSLLKIFLAVFISVFGAETLLSQSLMNYYDTLQLNHELIIDGNIEYFSSSIEKDITSKFYRGGFISSEMKERSFDKHGGVNRIGGVAQGDIEYRNYKLNIFKNKNWGIVVKGGFR